MRTTRDGRGAISVLAADKLMMNPRLYATFLLWLMSELFEELPEVGDPERPKLVFFFDEAHLLFEDAPKVLVDRVEQVVRLIRSKGVGVYSSPRTRSISPKPYSPSSATASSTRCAPIRRASRKRSGPPPIHSGPIPTSTAPWRSPSSAPARRWSRRWKPRACRPWCSGR
ncbi:hypothetical protein AJ88_08535 [Mesorhizobium amorphae CCBAU 01583]|nr:hypothetical protein AJ88_08535 [Mesorhizobium amorphae CCBAU 01583]